MTNYIISELYIKESIRLRTLYFDTIDNIQKKKDLLIKYGNILEQLANQVEKLDVENDPDVEKKAMEQHDLIMLYIERLQKSIMPEHLTLKKIEEDTKKLYEAIQEKYKGITTEEIKRQIIPHLIAKEKEKGRTGKSY